MADGAGHDNTRAPSEEPLGAQEVGADLGEVGVVKTVFFEETNEEREVTAFCRRCKTSRDDFGIVSPGGMAHHSDGYDGTACGMDATGETWWWRL